MEETQVMLALQVIRGHQATPAQEELQVQVTQVARVTQEQQVTQEVVVTQVQALLMEVLANRGRLETLG